MIGHDYPGVQVIMPQCHARTERGEERPRDHRFAEESWATAPLVEQAIHRRKCTARGHGGRGKTPISRETILQTKSDELRLANNIEMRESTSSDGHIFWWPGSVEVLRGGAGGLRGRRRPGACPTHQLCSWQQVNLKPGPVRC